MKKFTGKGVYGAIAMGKISVFQKQDTLIQRTSVKDTEAEKARVEAAKAAAAEQLQAIYEKALKEVGETNAQIFEIHMMMLEDDDYNESIQNIIDTQKVNAEYAVSITADNFAEMFSAMDDAYMQARAADVRDISDRIIANLTGNVAVQEDSGEKHVICADDLAPSETVSLDKDKVLAFVTAHGSSNSHTAILARNMNIPAVIGVGSDFLKEVQNGTEAIVDGFTGEIFVEPDEETRRRLLEKQKADEEKKRLLLELKGKENVTRDGTKVNIYANRLHAIKRYMDKRNLPGIPQEFLEIFFTASNNTEALMDELEGDKINIESTNRLLEILTNDMNELEEAAYRIVQNATLTEQLLQYSNRYRSFDDHVQAAFDESLYIFEREYDYAASFKVISDALEMVEAGVTDRFVTSYEKTREQIRF